MLWATLSLGIALLSGGRDGGSCSLNQTQGVVYGSAHFQEPQATNVGDCCGLCSAAVRCVAYTWAADTKTCFLKDNTDGASFNRPGRVSGRKHAGPSPPSAPPAKCTIQDGIEYLGDDVGQPQPTVDEGACCYSCGINPVCKFFTYDGGKHGLCHHKNTNAPDYSRHNSSCTSGYPGTTPPTPTAPSDVTVALAGVRSTTGPNFLCWNIDASANRGFFWRNISADGPYGAQLAKQAAALGAGQAAGYSLLRFGGSGNDYLTYAFGGTPCPDGSDPYKQCLNETQWRDLLSFTAASNARMIFGLSMNTGRDLDLDRSRAVPVHDSAMHDSPMRSDPFPYPWDPTNAKAILQWTIDNKLDHLITGLELGNEQNSKYTGAMTAADFAILYNLTLELWPDAATRPGLYGPDPHSLHDASGTQLNWIAEFLDGCAKLGVPMRGVTHHEYTEVDPTVEGFTAAATLAKNGAIAAVINATVRAHNSVAGIFGGEIGPHNGGSPPCDHTSMRWAVFGDSLWYADALAAKAKNGYTGFCRQDYIGADYGLVDCSTGTPLPDFYTALTWTRTMGEKVLDVAATGTKTGRALPAETSAVRIYAHCTAAAESAVVAKGSVTVLAINLGNASTMLHFGAAAGGGVRQYLLSADTGAGSSLTNATGMLGTGVLLNGAGLKLGPAGDLPPMVPSPSPASASMSLPARALAFYVLPGADHPSC